MAILTLVRHGQASFGAANYDVLSELGQRQSEHLGAYFQLQGVCFSRVLTGSLQRHAQTLAGIVRGMEQVGNTAMAKTAQAASILTELNEYDSHALLVAWHALQPLQSPEHGCCEPLAATGVPAPADAALAALQRKNYFRQLKLALAAWMDGRIAPAGMPAYATFARGLAKVLAGICQEGSGPVLLVSSGGPIAQIVAHILQAPAASAIALNMQLRNSAVTETIYSPRGHQLLTFNTLPHLVAPEAAHLITSA